MAKHLGLMATMACMKTLLMLINCILWVVGILMLCTGIWLRIELGDYVDINTDSSRAAFLALACLGALLTLIATFACCCTTRGHPALLYVYGAFLAVIVILELGAGASIYAYRTDLDKQFDQDLNETMAVYGQNTKKSNYIDFIQSTLFCCGNRGYNDWLNMYPSKDMPNSCCKNYVLLEGESQVEQSPPPCDVSDVDQIYTQGCYTRVLGIINGNIGMVASLAIGVTFFPFVGIFLACCLASNINKMKYEQVA
ncbi:tetraspanin-7-like [Ceratina calcarata]|uniref:Tetraspanin n=1 Tax=Ceratina calcarata TaxID=156304 RepID=A0AAJ7N688_9HYME|nr:tetraspanin-7-like [Ceratina calcarata]